MGGKKLSAETLTPKEEVLLAALHLTQSGKQQFTEWDLTVECWKINKQRWGLPGYRDEYPDHKRVMNVIMSREGSVLTQGLVARSSTNTYTLTTLGLLKAESLTASSNGKERANYGLYDALRKYLTQNAYIQFLGDREKPTSWLYVASFYGLSSTMSPQKAKAHIAEFEKIVEEAERTIDSIGEESIRRREKGQFVSKKELENLKEFHRIVQIRFESQFRALLEA